MSADSAISLDSYSFKEKNIGHAYIFANETFDSPDYPDREGNEHDVETLKTLLKDVGFIVEKPFLDMKKKDCKEKMKEIASRKDLDNEECMLMAFLSHGDLSEIRMKDGKIDVQKVINKFTENSCKYLINKPKIFIFQTCSVTKQTNDDGDDEIDANGFYEDSSLSDLGKCSDLVGSEKTFMPKGADFICCYPTSPGFFSYRSPKHGSFFIRTFAEVVSDYLNDKTDQKVDFISLLTLITKKISKAKEKQIPWFSTTLRKHLHLRKVIEQTTQESDMMDTTDTDGSSFFDKHQLDHYTLNEGDIGHAYIFSNETFKNPGKYKTRKGNHKDVEALENTLAKMGFVVETLKDLNATGCIEKLESIASNKNYSNDSCMLMVFLSHGSLDKVRMFNGDISVKDVMETFTNENCKYLANKPKIFIFQTCRGNETNNHVELSIPGNQSFTDAKLDTMASPRSERKIQKLCLEEVTDGESYMPIGPDFMCCFATSPGYVSYRNKDDGSFYIQKLSQVLNHYVADERNVEIDFATLMKLVSSRVSDLTATGNKGKKQMPWFSSTMGRKLYFRRAAQHSKAFESTTDEHKQKTIGHMKSKCTDI